jgi:hypothetical protein
MVETPLDRSQDFFCFLRIQTNVRSDIDKNFSLTNITILLEECPQHAPRVIMVEPLILSKSEQFKRLISPWLRRNSGLFQHIGISL